MARRLTRIAVAPKTKSRAKRRQAPPPTVSSFEMECMSSPPVHELQPYHRNQLLEGDRHAPDGAVDAPSGFVDFPRRRRPVSALAKPGRESGSGVDAAASRMPAGRGFALGRRSEESRIGAKLRCR